MLNLSSKDYMDYILAAAKKIAADGEYITQLDAATGDGDHWTNINSGFKKLVSMYDELASMPLSDMFKKIGMALLSTVGGASGALYGTAYIAASKSAVGKASLDLQGLCDVLETMAKAIMERGNQTTGQKTMVDALCPAVDSLKDSIAKGVGIRDAMEKMKAAAINGANSTKDMVAVKGRAVYQANKGVGHLDPGAVTMSYQLISLADFISQKAQI